MKAFLQIDEQLSLHLARPELAAPIFEVVDAQRNYLRQWLPWVDATQSVEDSRQFLSWRSQNQTGVVQTGVWGVWGLRPKTLVRPATNFHEFSRTLESPLFDS